MHKEIGKILLLRCVLKLCALKKEKRAPRYKSCNPDCWIRTRIKKSRRRIQYVYIINLSFLLLEELRNRKESIRIWRITVISLQALRIRLWKRKFLNSSFPLILWLQHRLDRLFSSWDYIIHLPTSLFWIFMEIGIP